MTATYSTVTNTEDDAEKTTTTFTMVTVIEGDTTTTTSTTKTIKTIKRKKEEEEALPTVKRQEEYASRGKAGVYTAEEEAEVRRLMKENPDATPVKIYKMRGEILKSRKRRSISNKMLEIKKFM